MCRLLLPILLFPLLLLAGAGSAGAAATINVINDDGVGEGFDDPTGVAPVGGNPGTTLGAQRLNAFEFAADLWADLITSDVEIQVVAEFNPLFCDPNVGAVLGQAGAGGGGPRLYRSPRCVDLLSRRSRQQARGHGSLPGLRRDWRRVQ